MIHVEYVEVSNHGPRSVEENPIYKLIVETSMWIDVTTHGSAIGIPWVARVPRLVDARPRGFSELQSANRHLVAQIGEQISGLNHSLAL